MQDRVGGSSGYSRSVRAMASGAAGALVLTGLHESARRIVPHAPRMDVIGERALAATWRAGGLAAAAVARMLGDAE